MNSAARQSLQRRLIPRVAVVLTKGPAHSHLAAATTATTSRRLFSNDDTSSDEQHRLFKEQMEDLVSEREAIFGFTEKEQDAWSNMSQHKHEASFLEQVEQARSMETKTLDTADGPKDPSSWNYPRLTHLSEDGKAVHMVDVGAKSVSRRVAVAQSIVVFPPEVMEAFETTGAGADGDLIGPKGPIFATAKLAGIMAAKKTSELIPLCHPLPLDYVNVTIRLENGNTAVILCECRVTHKTGVEMEALTGASVAALTIYDMVKAVSHNIRIEQTVLISKRGGKRTVGSEE